MDNENDLSLLNENFDVLGWLDDEGFSYSHDSPHAPSGNVAMTCPLCQDHSDHLSIKHVGAVLWHCWICEERGNGFGLVMRLKGVSFSRACKILEQYQGKGFVAEKQEVRADYDSRVLPDEFERIEQGREPELVKRWFHRRRFPLSICAEWGLGWCEFGHYALHLIVPVELDGEVVSFQAADLTGKALSKYRSCPDGRSVRPLKHCLYGLDVAARGEQVILVEGMTDKWRIGDEAVAMFGKGWTREQMLLLWERARDKRIKVLLDLDAAEDGEGLSDFLDERFPRVAYVRLEDGDPKDPGEFDEGMVRKVVSA